jgi:hypothetical protein
VRHVRHLYASREKMIPCPGSVSSRSILVFSGADGNLVDVRLSDTRDLVAAAAFFRSVWQVIGVMPYRITTGDHNAYPRAIRNVFGNTVVPSDQSLPE